jgi:hypothetical protein
MRRDFGLELTCRTSRGEAVVVVSRTSAVAVSAKEYFIVCLQDNVL